MCGIAGAIDLRWEGRAFDPQRLEAMCRAISHRGPDDQGSFFAPGLAMGATRLALMDPVNGAQPMTRQAVTVTVNGERFDTAEARSRLETRGHRFTTRCDTEIWALGWLEDGLDALALSRGQFAGAFWDGRARQLVLARDRWGICPLFFAEVDGWLLWASEAKALLASGLVEARLDPVAIDHMLVKVCQSTFRSSFEGITPVRPGHFMRFGPQQRRPEQRRWFSLDLRPKASAAGQDQGAMVDELEALMVDAVVRRMSADAPVATYLSAGVDSSLVTAIAARHCPQKVTSFTLHFDGVGRDESGFARQTASALGIDCVVETITPARLAALFRGAVMSAEAPVIDHANCCLLALSGRVQAEGFKAVLTGEGADEAFAGYPWFKLHQLPPGSRWLPGAALSALGLLVGGRRAALTRGWAADESLAQTAMFKTLARGRIHLYSEAFWEALVGSEEEAPWEAGAMDGLTPLARSQMVDYHLLLPGHLLADKGDRMAMSSSVEPRFPYLDERVVGFAAALPDDLKLRRFKEKFLLREVARRYLPTAAARRPKHMLRALPLIHDTGRPRWVDQLVSPESLRRTGLFDVARVAKALERRRGRSLSPRAWLVESHLTGVVSTQLLHHLFCGGQLCDLEPWSPG